MQSVGADLAPVPLDDEAAGQKDRPGIGVDGGLQRFLDRSRAAAADTAQKGAERSGNDAAIGAEADLTGILCDPFPGRFGRRAHRQNACDREETQRERGPDPAGAASEVAYMPSKHWILLFHCFPI